MAVRFGLAFAGLAALSLAACNEADEAAAPSEPVTQEQIAAQTPNAPLNRPIDLLADGLVIQPSEAGGDGETLNFGAPQDAVVEALTMVFGGPQFGTNEECPAGPITFATYGDFAAHFQDESFVGWSVNGPSERANYSGPDGVTIGMAGADARKLATFDAYEDSTLGEEFMIGDGEMAVSGLIDDGQISTLWAGVSCNFR